MNVNKLLIAALKTDGLSVFPEVYKGEEKKRPESYYTFNYTDERPVVFSGDDDEIEATYIDVHFYSKKNTLDYKIKIRRALRKAGFTIQGTSGPLYEEKTKYNHITVSAYITSAVEV